MSEGLPVESAPLCAEVSRRVEESLLGTASKDGLRFVLVESDDVWGRDAFASSTLSEAVKKQLVRASESFERTRVVFVRPPGRRAAVPRVYVTGGPARGDRVFVLDLPSFDALGEAPIEAMLGGDPSGARVLDTPLALVCTHGKRDRCCAKFGVALVEKLSAEPGVTVLQSSHLGGHRFAAVVVTLPDGFSYGHLDASDAAGLAAAMREGRVFDPARYRGRAGLDEPMQVAEARIRLARGLPASIAIEPVGIEKTEAGASVRMRLGDEILTTIVRRRMLPTVERPASCFEAPSATYTFDVVDQSPT